MWYTYYQVGIKDNSYNIQDSSLGCVRREIPGVAQVDEKGHEGNCHSLYALEETWNISLMRKDTVAVAKTSDS